MTVLVIAEHDNTTTKSVTLSAVMTVKACSNARMHVLVAGFNATAMAQAVTQTAGVVKMIYADGASLADGLAENFAAQVLVVVANYSHILFPATASGKNVTPRVVVKLDVAQISDVTKVESFDTFERPICAGDATMLVQSSDAIEVVTARTTTFEAAVVTGGSGAVEATEYVADSGQNRLVGREVIASGRPELASAKIVVSGGRALGSAEGLSEVVTPLVDKLGAAADIGRATVDADYAPNDLQAGQAGKTVAPQLCIALGIPGAIQHLAGMKDSKVIVAVNKDPEAPIFSITDYGLAADLFTIVLELVKALQVTKLVEPSRTRNYHNKRR